MKLLRLLLVTAFCYALICLTFDPALSWYAGKTGGMWLHPNITRLSQMHVAYAKNLGAPYGGCYMASDLGMTTDDTGDNTTLITTFITTALTNSGYPAARNSICIFADGQVLSTGKWASAGWGALGGTIRFISSGSTQANSRPANSAFHGFDLTYTSGTPITDCKIQATWSGGIMFGDIDLWSSGGNSDNQCFLGATNTSPILLNTSISSGVTNGNGSAGTANTGIGINYGMGIGFSGYGARRVNTRFLGLCIAARYDGGAGNGPNNIIAIGDYYLGGDKTTLSNCDVYDGSSSNAGTNNVFRDGLIEFWDAANAVSTVNAAFRMNVTIHWMITGNGFWDCGNRLVIRSTGSPSNLWMDDSNYFSCSDANIVTTGGFPLRRGDHIPEHLMTGTTGSIGGGALLAGACASGTVAIAQAPTGYPTSLPAPTTYPGDGFTYEGYVSADGTVTVKVCAQVAGTPTASTYTIQVLQPNK